MTNSFSPISFSALSFTVLTAEAGSGGSKKRNRFRAWIVGLARDFRNFFRIKPAPPPPEDVEIPPAQPPKIFHILPSPPTMETKLETLNDKWEKPISVVASIPDKAVVEPLPEKEILSFYPVYPLVLNPLIAPLIQTKVTLPRATKQPHFQPYMVGEGSHIESKTVDFKMPRNRSRTASTINTLMILLEIERQV